MTEVARLIREERERKGWTQAELARRSGVPKPSLNAYEREKRGVSLGTLRKLAVALEVPVSRLVERSEAT